MAVRRHVFFSGNVQGVGFRYTAGRAAGGLDVAGFVRNLSDGRVELVAEGEPGEVRALLEEIRGRLGRYIRGEQVEDEPATGEFDGFSVRPTR